MTGGLVNPVPGPQPRRPAVYQSAKAAHAQYDRDVGIMRLVLAGDLVVEDLEDAVQRVLLHPEFRVGMPVLWDLSLATVVGLSAGDFRRLHFFVQVRKAKRGGGKTAVVVAHIVDYGLVRMFELMCHDLPTKIAVFRELVSAEAWLLADVEP